MDLVHKFLTRPLAFRVKPNYIAMGAEDVDSLRNNLGKVTKKLAMDKSEEQKKFE